MLSLPITDPLTFIITCRVDVDWNIAFVPYGERWRRRRKTFVSRFGIRKADDYSELQESMTKKSLRRLLHTPEDFLELLQLCVSANKYLSS